MAAEHEHLTGHLSEAERAALLAAAAGEKVAQRLSSRRSMSGAPGLGGVPPAGGGDGGDDDDEYDDEPEDFEAPRVQVDKGVLRKLHRGMSEAEKEYTGHMRDRKLRSSFVDNTPADRSYFAPSAATTGSGGSGSPGVAAGSAAEGGFLKRVGSSGIDEAVTLRRSVVSSGGAMRESVNTNSSDV